MPYVIDGHNLIGKLSTIDLADPDDEIQLIRVLVHFLIGAGKRGTVFFDHRAPMAKREQKFGRLSVRFTSHPRSADDDILQYLRSIAPEAPNYTVVTSDAELQKAANRIGARIMPSEVFAGLLTYRDLDDLVPGKPDETVSPEEIEYWEQLFTSGNSDK
jgi:predicted RNA-binding protein with PIN domain